MMLKILAYPHKDLRKPASPATEFNDSLRHLVKQMFDTMYAIDGWGLAATQVGIPLRIFVMDVSNEKNQPLCLINATIISKESMAESEEDCLSFPGILIKVPRSHKITVQYQDEFGASQTITVEGLQAYCIQHEIDHLDGKLMIDYLSKLKRERILKKYHKLQLMGHDCGEPSCHQHHH